MTQSQMEPLKLLCHLEGSKNQEGGKIQGASYKGTNHHTFGAKQMDPHYLIKKKNGQNRGERGNKARV